MSTPNDETFDAPDDAAELDDTQLEDVAGGQSDGWKGDEWASWPPSGD